MSTRENDFRGGPSTLFQLNRRLDPTKTGQDATQLYNDLHARVVGQDEAIDQIVNVYQTHVAGMNSPCRPVGTFLFLGPTGSGKTRLVEAAAESLVADSRALIKIDCAEFQHGHEIAKLIGSPPGYLGHRETHPLLSQETLDQYQTQKMKLSFVLFDEIEKASDTLWNLLLGILDKATLTLGDNRRVDFSRAMIFMTSNLGGREIGSILKPRLGFAASENERRYASGQLDESAAAKITNTGLEAARRKFTPEFMNRLDKVVVFKPLGLAELRKILSLELNILQRRILKSTAAPFVFMLSEDAKDHLLQEGVDMKYGARHLKRCIDRAFTQPLSNLVATRQVGAGDLIKIDFDCRIAQFTFMKEAEAMTAHEMARMLEAPVEPPGGALPTATATESPRFTVRAAKAPADDSKKNRAA